MTVGIAQRFWLRVEQERVAKGMTKEALSTATARHTPDGKVIPRSTIDNLRTTTRPPQPRIVFAIADALGLDRTEAAELAGVLPARTADDIDVRRAIESSPTFTAVQKTALLELVDAMDAANRARGGGTDRGHTDRGRSANQEPAV